MEGLRQYILSVTAASLICGVASGLVRGAGAKELIRLLCGLILALAAVRPLTKVELSQIPNSFSAYREEGAAAADAGEKDSREALAALIKAETEAYILDKAAALNAAITVEVTLTDGELPLPAAAVLEGSVTAYARQQLETILQEDLGIPKERQQWTG